MWLRALLIKLLIGSCRDSQIRAGGGVAMEGGRGHIKINIIITIFIVITIITIIIILLLLSQIRGRGALLGKVAEVISSSHHHYNFHHHHHLHHHHYFTFVRIFSSEVGERCYGRW